MSTTRRCFLEILVGPSGTIVAPATGAIAATAREINVEANRALQILYAIQLKSRRLALRARGILVSPRIVKAGFVIGGEGGDGALRLNGRTVRLVPHRGRLIWAAGRHADLQFPWAYQREAKKRFTHFKNAADAACPASSAPGL